MIRVIFKYVYIVVFSFYLLDVSGQNDSILLDSGIVDLSEIESTINITQDIDQFILELEEIKRELEVVNSILKENDYTTLNKLIMDNSLQHLFINYNYNNYPIKLHDTIFIEFKGVHLYTDYSFNIATKYINNLILNDTNEINIIKYFALSHLSDSEDKTAIMVKRWLNIYSSIKKKNTIRFLNIMGYEKNVDPLPDMESNKIKYSEYLLSLIEVLLKNYSSEYSFEDYIQRELKMEITSTDQVIKIRSKFLKYYYDKFSKDHLN